MFEVIGNTVWTKSFKIVGKNQSNILVTGFWHQKRGKGNSGMYIQSNFSIVAFFEHPVFIYDLNN